LHDGTLRHAFGDWPEDHVQDPVPPSAVAIPDWALTRPPEPARQPDPVSPSGLGGAKTLPGEGEGLSEAEARERGRKLHLLLEHLPGANPVDWPRMAASLLGDGPGSDDLLAEAIGVLSDPALAPVFQPGTLAEVGITADWNGQRLAGTIDRLVLTPGHALIVDFKSNQMIPDRPEQVPEGYLRQMGAYAHAIAQIYPERRIQTAILWTRAPRMMLLDPDIVRQALTNATNA
jgi:ATP-dependent helicase/nuclease subunit A